MEIELNNQALAYIQAFEITTKARVNRISINDDSVIFFVDPKIRINPKLVRKFIRTYQNIINKKIYVVPEVDNPKRFIITYLRDVVNLKPSNIAIAKGIVVIRVPQHLKNKVIGRRGVRIRTLEKLLKEIFGNINKVVVIGEQTGRNNAR